MADPDQPSARVVSTTPAKRRNRGVEILADGNDGIRAVGNAEYVNQLFDTIDDDAPGRWREWSTFTPAEVTVLDRVQRPLLDAPDRAGMEFQLNSNRSSASAETPAQSDEDSRHE
jgi:hypothetical protein